MEVSRDAVHLKGIGVPDDATTSDTRDATEKPKSNSAKIDIRTGA